MDKRNAHFQSIMLRFQRKKISASQAITEAASIRQDFDIVAQLQANFAFTKAYVAESTGRPADYKEPISSLTCPSSPSQFRTG